MFAKKKRTFVSIYNAPNNEDAKMGGKFVPSCVREKTHPKYTSDKQEQKCCEGKVIWMKTKNFRCS